MALSILTSLSSSAFAVTQCTVTMSKNVDGGSITPGIGVHYYDIYFQVTVSASPSLGYLFDGWLVDGQIRVPNNPWSFTLNHNTLVQATFIESNVTLIIELKDGGYTNPAAGTYILPRNAYVEIYAYPDNGSILYNWAVNGGINQGLIGVNPLQWVMTGNCIIAPIFTERVFHYVTLMENNNGHCNLNWGEYVVFTEDPYFNVTAIPDSGYQFAYWLIDGVPLYTQNPLGLFVDRSVIVQPTFIADTEPPPVVIPPVFNFFPMLLSLIPAGFITGALGISFSQIGSKLGEHAYAGFFIGCSIGLVICANSDLLPVWFVTTTFFCGFIALYFWMKGD